MAGNPLRGIVEFPLFEGAPEFAMEEPGSITLRFTVSDLIELKRLYKPDGKQFTVTYKIYDGDTRMLRQSIDVVSYRDVIFAALEARDEEAIIACLMNGLKRADGKSRFSTTKKTWEDPPFFLYDAIPFIADALSLAFDGRTQAQLREEAAKVAQATLDQAKVEGMVTGNPTQTSSGFSTQPREAESTPTLLGD